MPNPVMPPMDFVSLAPVGIVGLTGLIGFLLETIFPRRANKAILIMTLLGLVVASFPTISTLAQGTIETAAGEFLRDKFGLACELLLLGSAALCVLFSEGYLREKRIAHGEFYPLLVWATAGAMVMSTSQNLLVLFLGLELLSISLYVLAGLSRNEQKSEEAAIKYFLLGAFASAFFLFGVAFVFGATGSLSLADIARVIPLNGGANDGLLLFGLAMLLVGLAFKSGFAPFHQWTPDVYQGAPTNVTAFMAACSKIAAIATLVRVLDAFGGIAQTWLPVMSWVAILTMTLGNIIALAQKDVKRTLGYSSIAHAGYLLVALLSRSQNPQGQGYGTVIYYLLSYSLMTIGAFAVITLTAKSGKEGTEFSDLHGLWRRSPLATGLLILFMASLIGIPPTAGFFGKFLIFNDALAAGLTPLAIVLAVNSIISTFYYLGIVRAAFVESDDDAKAPTVNRAGVTSACILCAVGILAAVVFYTPLTDFLRIR